MKNPYSSRPARIVAGSDEEELNTTGAPWRVSAIQVSTGGTVYCKPINKA